MSISKGDHTPNHATVEWNKEIQREKLIKLPLDFLIALCR